MKHCGILYKDNFGFRFKYIPATALQGVASISDSSIDIRNRLKNQITTLRSKIADPMESNAYERLPQKSSWKKSRHPRESNFHRVERVNAKKMELTKIETNQGGTKSPTLRNQIHPEGSTPSKNRIFEAKGSCDL